MEMIVRHGERVEELHLEEVEQGYRLRLGETTYEVDAVSLGNGTYSLLLGGRHLELSVVHRGEGRYEVLHEGGNDTVEVVDPLTHLAQASHGAAGRGGPRKVTAYMPGRVVEILVAEGDEVAAGQGVVVLEAMKMENEIAAESAGVS
jgi:biotin carboxyl carrier protein